MKNLSTYGHAATNSYTALFDLALLGVLGAFLTPPLRNFRLATGTLTVHLNHLSTVPLSTKRGRREAYFFAPFEADFFFKIFKKY
jgi:hypothetical protein